MDAVRNWVRGIAVLMLFAGVIEMMLPTGDLRKYARTALGLLVVLGVIGPLAQWKAAVPAAFPNVFERVPAGGRDLDERERRLLEWQAEAIALQMPGVKSASAEVILAPEPSAVGARLRVDMVNVRLGAGGVRPVVPVETRGSRPTASQSGPGSSPEADAELVSQVRAAIALRFGIPPDRVRVTYVR